MIDVISNLNQHLYHSEMEALYRFRHWYFVDRLGWEDIRQENGREVDQYDNENAIHLARFDHGRPVSYTRLIPTDRPHLLSEVYPHLMDGRTYDTGPDIWEWTRFSVDPEYGNLSRFNEATQTMFHAVAEYAVFAGIKHLIVETHPLYMSWLMEMGWDVKPISDIKRIEGTKVVVFEATPTEGTIAVGSEMLDLSRSMLMFREDAKTFQKAS